MGRIADRSLSGDGAALRLHIIYMSSAGHLLRPPLRRRIDTDHDATPRSPNERSVMSGVTRDRAPQQGLSGRLPFQAGRDVERPVDWAIADRPVAYLTAMDFMTRRANAIRDEGAAEMAWLIEHPSLYTAGTSAKPGDLLDRSRFPVYPAGRGGQYTYHGPGQRIVYLMLDVKRRGGDIRGLISDLERWVITALDAFNVKGERRPGRVGIWVTRRTASGQREDKIAAIGLRVSRWVTTHGISLNVEPDLTHYRGIVPCGITEHGVTSLADLGLPVTLADADVALRAAFESVFGPVRFADAPQIGAEATASNGDEAREAFTAPPQHAEKTP